MILNLGCGNNKIEGTINVDCEESLKPDVVCNFVKGLPYEDDEVDEIYLFHTIEHIEKRLHRELFLEINRVLKPNGLFFLSFPEFTKCVENWSRNYKGRREFWEQTIFGRQLYESDYHVCIIDSLELKNQLEETGFHSIEYKSEPDEPWNTIFKCYCGDPYISYERLLLMDIEKITAKK